MASRRKKRRTKIYAIVVSRFNEFITKELLTGCQDEFKKLGIKKSQLEVYWVPGAFEIPLLAQKLAQKRHIEAVVGLGAVIRGETIHFDLVAKGAADGIMQAGLRTGKPIVFGLITAETVQQAYDRSSDKKEHKGREAAETAVEMVRLLKKI